MGFLRPKLPTPNSSDLTPPPPPAPPPNPPTLADPGVQASGTSQLALAQAATGMGFNGTVASSPQGTAAPSTTKGASSLLGT